MEGGSEKKQRKSGGVLQSYTVLLSMHDFITMLAEVLSSFQVLHLSEMLKGPYSTPFQVYISM